MFAPLADLDRHASERPDEIALSTPGREHTFAQLKSAVDAVAIRLRGAGVAPRNVVAIDLPAALEWIVDLALLRLATRSVSLRGVPSVGSLALDVLLTEPGKQSASAGLVMVIDDAWLADAVSGASGVAPLIGYPRPDSVFRLMLTSGTTGIPRAAAYSVAALEYRRHGLDRYWADGRAELNFMALSTTGGFHTGIADLRHGQAHLAVDYIDEEAMRFAAAAHIRVLCGSPIQIAGALQVLATHGIELPELEEVRMAGSSPSATLMHLIADRLRVPVKGIYGSTEGGGVTMRMLQAEDDLLDVGQPLPGFELQIVNDIGEPVPAGTEGLVRYRGPGLVSGYYDAGSVTPFAGGWFAPGDIGMLAHNDSLVLGGRTAELINVGGL
ncbi:MAG: hypothetical protein JWO10_662, partial [Microbacteriaceae bacterium]|nr:hypothetical protein [Microbacteriaceae bacterium]